MGSITGGTPFIITGTGFTIESIVSIGSNLATDIVWIDSTQMQAVTPAIKEEETAGTYPVIVDSIEISQFTYVNPIITQIEPSNGSILGGTYCTLIGIFLTNVQHVIIGVNEATIESISNAIDYIEYYIYITTPANIVGSYSIKLLDINNKLLVESEVRFTYVNPPTITKITPNNVLSFGGTIVIIIGENFITLLSNPLTITVGGYNVIDFTINSDIQITATIPAKELDSPSSQVLVINTTGGIASKSIIYVNPTIDSISPNIGSSIGGTSITITGTNFYDYAPVQIDTNIATDIVVVNTTTITATTPWGEAGLKNITVANITKVNLFTYVNPYIENISPSSGPTQGGTKITIRGQYFNSDIQSITIGTNSATSIVFIDTTMITLIIPELSPPSIIPIEKELVITWPHISLSSTYTYDNTVLINSVYPYGGPTQGDTPITIIGKGFIYPIIIKIGGNDVGNIIIDDTNTIIKCTTPAGNIGRQELIVICNGNTALYYFKYYSPLPQPPYHNRECPGPPYNATNFNSENPYVFNKLVSYAKNSPNYPWDTGVNPQEIYRSQQNTIFFNTLNEKTADVKNENNKLIANGKLGNMPYPAFKSQAERLMYIQGLTLNASRNKITGQNPSVPMGVPCSTIYNIINSSPT